MFRLPVCPHCGTIYRYQDTKNAWKQKENTCYHCHKKFRVKLMPYVAVEAAILIGLCIGFNILMLNHMSKLNLVALFAATLVFLLLSYLLIPFFIRFRKTEDEKSVGRDRPQNHKKNQKITTNPLMNKQKQQQSKKKRRS